MSSVRARVLKKPRDYCCNGRSREECLDPEYPKSNGSPGCMSFRCTRCKSTVGYCKGSVHGSPEHPANRWCNDCYCEVYLDPRDQARSVLEGDLDVKNVEIADDPVPTLEICLHRRGRSDLSGVLSRVRGTLKKTEINLPISWRVEQ